MQWGLVPSFHRDGEPLDHWKTFNARSETVAEKPTFSRLINRRRCVVVLDGFYEWKTDAGGRKQPYYIHFADGRPMKMAALYDVYCPGGRQDRAGVKAEGGDAAAEDDEYASGPPALHSYAILTTDSSPRMQPLHNRMPVLLSEDAAAAWLAPPAHHTGVAGDAEAATPGLGKLLAQVCQAYNEADLVWHPVTPAMSKLGYSAPDCWQDMRTKKGAINSFFSAAAPAPAKPAPAPAVAAAAPAAGDAAADAAVAETARGGGGAPFGSPQETLREEDACRPHSPRASPTSSALDCTSDSPVLATGKPDDHVPAAADSRPDSSAPATTTSTPAVAAPDSACEHPESAPSTRGPAPAAAPHSAVPAVVSGKAAGGAPPRGAVAHKPASKSARTQKAAAGAATPAKGTIQSFFKPAAAAAPTPAKAAQAGGGHTRVAAGGGMPGVSGSGGGLGSSGGRGGAATKRQAEGADQGGDCKRGRSSR